MWEWIFVLSNTQPPGGSVVAGGLGDYGSDESDDEDDHSVRGSESSDTDEEELRHRIREKQDAFRRKEREMLQLQEKQAQEALLARGKKMTWLILLDYRFKNTNSAVALSVSIKGKARITQSPEAYFRCGPLD